MQEVNAEIDRVSRGEVLVQLGIEESRLKDYIRQLRRCCPSEFQYQPGQRTFDIKQLQILLTLRKLYLAPPEGQGLIKSQIDQILIQQGI